MHEPAERLRVEVAVGMRDEGPRDPEHSRIALERAVGELGQLPIEAARKVVADFANLLLDDMKVIHQPFGGRCDRAFLADRRGGAAVHFEQYARIGAYPRRNRASGPGAIGNPLRNRQRLAVLLEALDTEQLRADRFFNIFRERRARALHRPEIYKIQTSLVVAEVATSPMQSLALSILANLDGTRPERIDSRAR